MPGLPSTVDEVRSLLDRHLTADEADAVAALAARSIVLGRRREGHQAAPESTRLGGDPLLSPDDEWPLADDDVRPLSFLCQVRLDEIAPYDDEGLLPPEGLLLAFYDVDEQPWGSAPIERFGWRLLHVDPSAAELRPAPADATRFEPVALLTSARMTLPSWEEPALARIFGPRHPGDGDFEAWKEWTARYAAAHEVVDPDQGSLRHRVLGWPDLIQAPLHLDMPNSFLDELEWTETAEPDWRMVLQVDTDNAAPNRKFIWGDCGRLYFAMRRGDLERRAFENAWLELQCS